MSIFPVIVSILTGIENLLPICSLSTICLVSKDVFKNVKWPKNIVISSAGYNAERLQCLQRFLSDTTAISFQSIEGPIILPLQSKLRSFSCLYANFFKFDPNLLTNWSNLLEFCVDKTFTLTEYDFNTILDACLSSPTLKNVVTCFSNWSWIDDVKIFQLLSKDRIVVRLVFACPDIERKIKVVNHISVFSTLIGFGKKGYCLHI